MPRFSAFTRYGHLAFSGAPSAPERIYRSLRAAYFDPRSGVAAIDVTPGTYHEAKLYARAMALASAEASLKRAGNQGNPAKATEGLPHWERTYRLAPAPDATLDARRAEASARRKISRGNRWEAITDALEQILGDDLISVRAITVDEAATWPSSPGDGPGVYQRPEQPAKTIRLLEPVTTVAAPSTVAYEPWDANDSGLVLNAGDQLCIQPEVLEQAEKVTVSAVDLASDPLLLTATFENAHDEGSFATTGDTPLWWSTTGHLLIVVTSEAALDVDTLARVDNELMRRTKAGTTWSIVEPSTPGAETVGPFTLGSSPLGAVTVGEIPIEP